MIRDEIARKKSFREDQEYLAFLDARIDRTALMAFDCYMESRELLHKVRLNEVLSGRHIITDKPCPSTLLRRNPKESADNIQNNRLT